jgi:hypothetical protein
MSFSMHVTATSGGSTSDGIRLVVKVLTGAAAVQNGATAAQSCDFTVGAAHQATLTTTVTGSLVYGAIDSQGSTALTALANTTINSYFDSNVTEWFADCVTSAPTGTPGIVAVGASAPVGGGGCALAEILPNGTLAEDTSAPSVAEDDLNTTVTTADFAPPGGSLLVALVSASSSTGVETMTVSGGGVTWTPLSEANAANSSYAGVWIAIAPTPGPNDPIITATQSGSSSNRGMALIVKVLTGAIEGGGVTGAGSSGTGAVAQASINPSSTNSLPVFAISYDDAATGFGAAATNNAYFDNGGDATDLWSYAHGSYTGAVTSGTPVTVGAGAAIGDHSNWAALEVKPSGGSTPAIDASSPPLVESDTLLTVSTTNFTPPVGSVLVALVVAGGTGSGTGITMTVSGGGLAWTQRVVSSASDGFQPCFIWTATVTALGGAAPGLQPPEPPRYLPGKRPGLPFVAEPFTPWPPWSSGFQTVAGSVVTPSLLNGAVTFPAAAIRADETATTAVLAGTTAFPAVAITTGEQFTSSVLTTTASFPALAISASEIAAPVVLSGTVAFGASVVNAGETVAPSSLSGAVTFPAPVINQSQTETTAVLAGSAAFPALAFRADCNTVSGALLVTAIFPASAISASEVVTTAVLAGTTAFSAPTISTGEVVPLAVLSGTVSFPTPTISAGGNANVTTTALNTSVAFGPLTINASETVALSTLSLSASFVMPAISTGSVVTPTALTASVAFASSTVVASESVIPTTLSVSASFPSLTVQTGTTVTPTAVFTATGFAVIVNEGSSATPTTLAATAAFSPALIRIDETVALGTLSTLASFPAPTVSAGGNATVTPTALSVSASFTLLVTSAGETATAPLLSATTAFGAVSLTTGVVVSPSVLSGSATFVAPLVIIGAQVILYGPALGGRASTVLFGGSAQAAVPYGGTATNQLGTATAVYGGWNDKNMATAQNLVALQGNDTTFILNLTQYNQPLNLASLTVKLYVKANEQALDSSATVYTVGSGLTVIQALAGEVSWKLPHAAATSATTQWWRADVIDASLNVSTCLYGNLYIVAV